MGRLPEFVCASNNPDKVIELQALLVGVCTLLPRPAELGDVVEDEDTLLGNARLKAAAVATATGCPAVSDDTGLFVDALDGRPGVFTARYAGESASYADNRATLLDELSGATNRRARFVTVAMVVWPDGSELAVEGICEGRIADGERGQRGFGYDALFEPDEGGGRTFAEMSDEEKNAISHRGRAIRALALALRNM